MVVMIWCLRSHRVSFIDRNFLFVARSSWKKNLPHWPKSVGGGEGGGGGRCRLKAGFKSALVACKIAARIVFVSFARKLASPVSWN